MPLMTLAEPCWTFTCQHEDADAARWRPHAPHHPSQLPAPHGQGCDLPYELDAPCVQAVCDHCHIAYAARHFATQEQASEHLQAAGWTTDGHGRWHCDACPILYQLSATGDAAVRVAGAAR